MKTKLKSLFFVCLLLTMGVVTNSCTEETGDYLYDITVSDNTSTASYNSYLASGAQSTIFNSVKKISSQPISESTTVIVSGEKKDCDKKIKAAVNAGMDEVEAKSDYCSFFDISEVTVVIKSGNDNDKIIFSRKFKKK